jgi:hypothetical protein
MNGIKQAVFPFEQFMECQYPSLHVERRNGNDLVRNVAARHYWNVCSAVKRP